MISCTFAYAKGVETQSTVVELADPFAALFLVRNDDRARAALRAWLVKCRGADLSDLGGRHAIARTSAARPLRAA